MVTHQGRIPWLPRQFNRCYYSSGVRVNLVSLGYLNLNGVDYAATSGTPLVPPVLTLRFKEQVFATSTMLANNLFPVDIGRINLRYINAYLLPSSVSLVDQLANSTFDQDSDSDDPCVRTAPPLHDPQNSLVSSTISVQPPAQSLPSTVSTIMVSPSVHSTPFQPQHFSREDRKRADLVEQVHRSYVHPNDENLGRCFDLGLIPGCKLTSRDVRNNRILRGPCPSCIKGKIRRLSMPPSTNPPAPYIGHTLFLDLDKLDEATPGGYTLQVLAVDEKSGKIDIVGSKSKTVHDLFTSVWEIICSYKALGFTVKFIYVDSESSLLALRPRLHSVGIVLVPSPPGHHQQRIERHTQTVNNRTTAMLADLDFVLPAKYMLLARSNAAQAINLMQNSRSFPSTPFVLTEQKHPVAHVSIPFLAFGATAMIRMGDDKRAALSKLQILPYKNADKTELGVCLGRDSVKYPGMYLFVVANGRVVPRKTFTVVNCHAFNWPKKNPILAKTLLYPNAAQPVVTSYPEHIDSVLDEFPMSELEKPATNSDVCFSTANSSA